MLERTVYSSEGLFLRALTVPDEANLALNVEAGEVVVEGFYDDETYYRDGTVFQLPAKPYDFLVFDPASETWTDPRDPAQIAVDLYQARYHTNTKKDLIFYRMSGLGAYPVSELADDTNYFPDTVEEYLNTLAAAQHDTVKAAMKYEDNIWRLHPYLIGDPGNAITGFIPWLSSEKNVTITPEQLDIIFEVPVPPPLYQSP